MASKSGKTYDERATMRELIEGYMSEKITLLALKTLLTKIDINQAIDIRYKNDIFKHYTALEFAVKINHIFLIKTLLNAKANMNVGDYCPLLIAAQHLAGFGEKKIDPYFLILRELFSPENAIKTNVNIQGTNGENILILCR